MADKIEPPQLDALEGVDNWMLWIDNNVTTLSDKDLATLERWLEKQAPSVMGPDFPRKLEAAKEGATKRATEKLAERVQESDGNAVDLDVDGDGSVSPQERQAAERLPAKAAKETRKAAKAQGATDEQADEAGKSAEQILADQIAGNKPPPQILQQYITSQDGQPTSQQINDLIDAWNTLNPLSPVTNKDELYERLAAGGTTGGPIQKQVIEVGLLGAEPLIDYRIPTIDGQSYTVPKETFDILNRDFGYTSVEMTSAVRTAARAGLTDGRGEPAWQVLLGLANATRSREDLTPIEAPPRTSSAFAQADALASARRPFPLDDPYVPYINGMRPSDKERERLRKQYEQAEAEDNAAGVATASINYTSSQNLQNLAASFDAARSLYGGDDMLALLQVVDPSLAARVAVTDPGSLSLDDQRAVSEIFLDVGLQPDQLAALGYAWTSNFDGAGTRRGGGGGGSGRAQRAMPDPVALRQAATDLYRSLFAADPTDAQVAALAGAVTSAISTAPDNQTIDPNARLRQAVESTPEYSTFYGNKPEGMDDATYRAQFDQGAGAILGATAADPTTIQAGLRTGRVQTAVGAAAAQKSAWESSTWLGRLAAAAQTVSEWT